MVGNGVALAGDDEGSTTEKRAAIERLMEVTKAADMGAQMGAMIGQQIVQMSGAETSEAAARCREIAAAVIQETLADGELINEMIPIYEKYFTHDEILEMIAFHESPLGQKSLEVMPQLMMESMQVGQRWAMTVMPKVQERVLAQMRDEGLLEPEEEPAEAEAKET